MDLVQKCIGKVLTLKRGNKRGLQKIYLNVLLINLVVHPTCTLFKPSLACVKKNCYRETGICVCVNGEG